MKYLTDNKLSFHFFFEKYYYWILFFLITVTVVLAIYLNKIPGGIGHDGYLEIAQSIVSGKGYTINGEIITGRSPVYPYLLSIGLRFGFGYWWVWIVNFTFCFVSALLLKQILIKYEIKNSGFISILIACNPSVLWLAKNSMTYILSLFLITVIVWCFAYKKYLLSAPFSLLLFFTHPSFGVISVLIIISILYFCQNKIKATTIFIFSALLIVGYNIEIKKIYGGYPVFSATGAGYQYILARNQYTDGNVVKGIDISKKSGVNYETKFSTVTNRNYNAYTIDNTGRELLLKDILNPLFFIPKFINGLKNTLFSGMMPDIPILILLIGLIFYLLHVGNVTIQKYIYHEKFVFLFLSVVLLIQISIFSVVGFKMRYSAYFLPCYPLFIPLYLMITTFKKIHKHS